MLVLGGAVIHVSANRSFDKAAAELSSATQDARDAADELDVVADDAGDAVAASEAIVGSAADDLIDVGARTALADQAAATRESVDAAQARLSTGPSSELPDKPLWTWELLEATPTLEETAAELTEFAGELDADETAIQDAEAALVGSAVALYASAPAAAAALEAANVSAVNYVVLDFRDARDAVAGQTAVGSGAVDAFRTYAEKAATLKASAQTELAEKAGPLLSTRLEIEAFARSIAGGVVLDFDWAPIVNNIGGSAGMGGTATWVAMRGASRRSRCPIRWRRTGPRPTRRRSWPTRSATPSLRSAATCSTRRAVPPTNSGRRRGRSAWATPPKETACRLTGIRPPN